MSAIDKVRSFAGAREADGILIRDGLTYGDAREILRLMVAADRVGEIVAEEREACAKVADEVERMAVHDAPLGQITETEAVARKIAAKIRARWKA